MIMSVSTVYWRNKTKDRLLVPLNSDILPEVKIQISSLMTGGVIWRIIYHEMDTHPAISYYNRLLTKFFTLKY